MVRTETLRPCAAVGARPVDPEELFEPVDRPVEDDSSDDGVEM
jgi:hypothetical protein